MEQLRRLGRKYTAVHVGSVKKEERREEKREWREGPISSDFRPVALVFCRFLHYNVL